MSTTVSPTTEPRPTRQQAVAEKMGEPAPEREPHGYPWMVFVGAIFGLALVKEILGRIGRLPVIITTRSVSRTNTGSLIAALLGMLARIGARALGVPVRGT
jgi:hypothetical protein